MYPCAKIRIIIETAKLFLLFLHLIIYTRDFLVSAGRNFVYGLFFFSLRARPLVAWLAEELKGLSGNVWSTINAQPVLRVL